MTESTALQPQQPDPTPEQAAQSAFLSTLCRQRNTALDEVAQLAAANAGLAAENAGLRAALDALQAAAKPSATAGAAQ